MSLAVRGLHFAYGRRGVLHGIDFAPLARGQVTALIGPNAAGKSTLFRCLAGLNPSEDGTIFLDDGDLNRLDREDRSRAVCFMPQHFVGQAALSVFEVVLLARNRQAGWRVGRQDLVAVEALLRQVGIEALAERHIGELSGGQQQLVSLCQCLARTPSVFLLDEPTSALDLRHQLELMEIVAAATRERNVVTVIALHDLNLAARFADHLLLMNEGRVVAAGAPDDLLASPLLGETYGVQVELARTPGGALVTSASL